MWISVSGLQTSLYLEMASWDQFNTLRGLKRRTLFGSNYSCMPSHRNRIVVKTEISSLKISHTHVWEFHSTSVPRRNRNKINPRPDKTRHKESPNLLGLWSLKQLRSSENPSDLLRLARKFCAQNLIVLAVNLEISGTQNCFDSLSFLRLWFCVPSLIPLLTRST
jgi:hypothetical protein